MAARLTGVNVGGSTVLLRLKFLCVRSSVYTGSDVCEEAGAMRPVSIFLLAGLVALASQRFTVTEQLVSSIVGELSVAIVSKRWP